MTEHLALVAFLAIHPLLAFLHFNVVASHKFAIGTFRQEFQAPFHQFGTHNRIVVDAKGGAALFDTSLAYESCGFLFGYEFFERLVVEFFRVGWIFAYKMGFS